MCLQLNFHEGSTTYMKERPGRIMRQHFQESVKSSAETETQFLLPGLKWMIVQSVDGGGREISRCSARPVNATQHRKCQASPEGGGTNTIPPLSTLFFDLGLLPRFSSPLLFFSPHHQNTSTCPGTGLWSMRSGVPEGLAYIHTYIRQNISGSYFLLSVIPPTFQLNTTDPVRLHVVTHPEQQLGIVAALPLLHLDN